MIFLGNPASRHLETWRALYARRGRSVDALFTVHRPLGQFPVERRIAAGGKYASYALLGLWLRGLGKAGLIHAHGASGYGLAALLSGRRYGVTIYGSEVLGTHGRVYRAMVHRVLKGACFITVTADAAAARIRAIDPALGSKLLCFHTGIDPVVLAAVATAPAATSAPGAIRVLCIRNCGPQYRTREILAALQSVVETVPRFTLAVPLGNGDRGYFARLQAEFAAPWIDFIDDALPHAAFLERIRDADLCINFPLADQASATLIEAVWLDRIIVTADLDAYASLFACTADYGGWRIVRDPAHLGRVLAATLQSLDTARPGAGTGAALVAAHYGAAAAAAQLDPILELAS